MDQELAKRLLDSGLVEKIVNEVKLKLFTEFAKPIGSDHDYEKYDRLNTIHDYSVATDKVYKELRIHLTNIANKGKVK